jgi:hypothetical protein
MTMTTAIFDNIAKLAALMHTTSPKELQELDDGLAKLNHTELGLLSLAEKLLAGKRYNVTTDNPDTVRVCRAFAEYIGATVESVETLEWNSVPMTKIIFQPPPRRNASASPPSPTQVDCY